MPSITSTAFRLLLANHSISSSASCCTTRRLLAVRTDSLLGFGATAAARVPHAFASSLSHDDHHGHQEHLGHPRYADDTKWQRKMKDFSEKKVEEFYENMGKGAAHEAALKIDMRRASYDELSTPDGPWQEFYNARQKRYNMALGLGILSIAAVSIYIWHFDPFHFEKSLKPRKFMKNPPVIHVPRQVNGIVYGYGEPIPGEDDETPPPPPSSSSSAAKDTNKQNAGKSQSSKNKQQTYTEQQQEPDRNRGAGAGEWESFKSAYAKSYPTRAEETYRRSIFEDNVHSITEHNLRFALGKESSKMGMNHLGDLTNAEYKAMLNGCKGPRAFDDQSTAGE